MELKIIAENPDLIPKKAHEFDACYDIYSAEDAVVPAVGTCPISTGVKMSIPPGFFVEIRPRSGMSFKYGVEAFCGTIDTSYINEVKVLLKNSSIIPYRVHVGDRIAQFRVCKLEPTEIITVDEFDVDTIDRGGGMGSTGR